MISSPPLPSTAVRTTQHLSFSDVARMFWEIVKMMREARNGRNGEARTVVPRLQPHRGPNSHAGYRPALPVSRSEWKYRCAGA